MHKLTDYILYIFGFVTITAAVTYLNYALPPNFDEAHAWNIARYLSPIEIFTISKTEGHPFLWFYLLMPLAKTNFLYPYSLYFLNYILIIAAIFILYKFAPLPTYLKYLITASCPFLRFYSSFARSYSLSILLLFLLLYFYPKRNKKLKTYLLLILLLANTNAIGFIMATPFGCLILYEHICKFYKTQKTNSLLIIFSTALLEIFLLLLQFYGYDSEIPTNTPHFNTLTNIINTAFSPLNIPLFCILSLISAGVFLKKRCYFAIFFQLLTSIGLIVLLKFVHQGSLQHYFFFYIILIISFWLARLEKVLPTLGYIPLGIISFALIFNFSTHYKTDDRDYLISLKNSALAINQTFNRQPITIYTFSHIEGNIIAPYLSPNVILINQTMTPYKEIKAFKEILYPLYVAIDPQHIIKQITTNPSTLIYRTCGEDKYENAYFTFDLRHNLNNDYCLYDIRLKQ